MRVGISTACFYPYVNTEDTLEIIHELGFDLCEVFMEAESEMNEGFCYDLRDKAERLGIGIHSIHAFNATFEPFLFDRYKRKREEMEQKFIKVCRAAKILGAECYTFHGATRNISYGDPVTVVDRVGELCRLALDNGVRLSQENVSWCKSHETSYIDLLRQRIGGDISFTLDVKQAVRSGVDPQEFLHIYSNQLSTVHINDATAEEACLLPGKGRLDLPSILSAVSDIDPRIPFIIEVYCENYTSYDELVKAKEHLLKVSKANF